MYTYRIRDRTVRAEDAKWPPKRNVARGRARQGRPMRQTTVSFEPET